ncbi:MAG: SufD family Fe-S cluster assembly protein [Erysipelotrichaceae bacterium]|nr:SufD family Fe-S cluster assembly protein [Erysipelotrichaceae bacterium]
MSNQNVISIKAMGLAKDNSLHITNSTDDIYLIDDNITINVDEFVKASFIDITRNNDVCVTIGNSSNVNYIILDGSNSNRKFKVNGEIQITEIALEQTNESLEIDLNEENANAIVKCLVISSNMRNTFKQYISHNAKMTTSNITNVGVAMNKASISFDTTGKINKGNSSSKCQQVSRGIVMDDNSEVTAKPILLIDEYDCFANHGAAIGKMSDEDLFYLMSRGLCKKEAFLLILQGMIGPFIEAIKVDEWKEKIQSEVLNLIESD